MVRGSSPGGGEIFRTRPDRLCGPFSILYNGYRVYFPGVQRLGRGVNEPPPSSAEVQQRVKLTHLEALKSAATQNENNASAIWRSCISTYWCLGYCNRNGHADRAEVLSGSM